MENNKRIMKSHEEEEHKLSVDRASTLMVRVKNFQLKRIPYWK